MRSCLKGYTLMEVMLVTVIMAILLAAATPHLGRFIDNQRVRVATQSLQLAAMHGRTLAISTHGSIVICPSDGAEYCDDSSGWHAGWIIFPDSNSDRERQENELPLRVAAPRKGVTATSSIHRKRIRFLPNGTAAGTAMTINVCANTKGGAARSLVIANSGRIRQTRLSPGAAMLQCPAWN